MYTTYAKYPFYPGPVSLSPRILDVLNKDYGPPRFDRAFLDEVKAADAGFRLLFGTSNEVIFPSGEAMLGLWAALKCTLRPGDRVLTVGTGVYGDGFGDMAASLGCNVEKLSFAYDATLNQEMLDQVDAAIQRHNPLLITAVHCETPSGTLNPLAELGRIKKDRGVPLLVVDAVSSLGGVPLAQDDWQVDIMLGGSQKCLSCPPNTTIMSISPPAWERIAEINYQGYEALLPFKNAQQDATLYPYTPNWMGIAALRASCKALLDEGLDNVFARHERVAKACRDGLRDLGLELWTRPDAVNAPTVTAARIPKGFTWPEWRHALQSNGLVVAGSFGPMSGQVFRIGHMGVQADLDNLEGALSVIAALLPNGNTCGTN